MTFYKKQSFWILFILILSGGILRATFLIAPIYVDSDQAIFGLQGLHVWKGEFPAFSWGYAYIGTLQTYLDAAAFFLFGISRRILNAVPLVFYLGYALALYGLSRQLFKKRIHQMMAVSLAAIAPAYLMLEGTTARHGYPETLFFGTLLLAMAAQGVQKSLSGKKIFLMTFIAGLAFWTHFLILYYFIPLAFFFIKHFCDPLGIRQKIRHIFLASLGFIAGSLPFWIFNLRHQFWSFTLFKNNPSDSQFGKAMEHFPATLSILLGTRPVCEDYSILPFAGIFFIFLSFIFIWYAVTEGVVFIKQGLQKKISGRGLLWIYMVSMLVIFFKSKYSTHSSHLRYLFPFYTLYPPVIVTLIEYFHNRDRLKYLAYAVFIVILFVNVSSFWFHSPLVQSKVRDHYQTEIQTENDLFSRLSAMNKKRFLMFDYWRDAKWTFDAKEQLIFVNIKSRYPPYLGEIFSDPDLNYLTLNPDPFLDNGLHMLGTRYQVRSVPPCLLYTDFYPENSLPVKWLPTPKSQEINTVSHPSLFDLNYATMNAFPFKQETEPIHLDLNEEKNLAGMAMIFEKEAFRLFSITITDSNTRQIILKNKTGFYIGRRVAGKPYIRLKSDYAEIFFPPFKTKGIDLHLSPLKHSFRLKEILLFQSDPIPNPAPFQPSLSQSLMRIATYPQDCIYYSLGAWKEIEKHLPVKLTYQEKAKTIDFRKPALFVFENEAVGFNTSQLKEAGFSFSAEKGRKFSVIEFQPPKKCKALWVHKWILFGRDKLQAKTLFLEARKHFNGSQYTEALSDCITSLFYWENYRPSLDLMKLCYEKTGRQKEALQIQTRTEPWMHPPVFTNICFENGLCLRGLKLTKNSFKSGDAIEITYYFEAASDHDLDFFLFVHFKNCDGATLFQNDHRISGDTALIKGELIQDHQTIHIPETEKYSGPVDLCLGLWQPEKNKRLKMKTALPHKNKEAVLEKILIINE